MTARAFGLSHVGLRRTANEDSYLVDEGLGLFAVADGMGGHAAGEVASRLAIETLAARLRESPERVDSPAATDVLVEAVRAANDRIGAEIRERDDLKGMGTTLVAVLLCSGPEVVVAHVGDSRAYLVREGSIRRLTRDHSWVNEQVQLGILSEQEAESHPFRNVITRALGTSHPLPVDTSTPAVRDGDILLLCSDGLNGMIPDETILRRVLDAGGDLEAASRDLVAAANDAGGEDNVTVVLLRIDRADPGDAPSAS